MLPARLLLLLVLLVTPWWFGAVEESAQVYVFVGIAAACACALFARRDTPVKWPLVLVPLAAAVALGLFQLCPLPTPIARLVSPHEVGFETASNTSSHPTVSLRPAATRYDLSLLVLAIAAFVLGASLFDTAASRQWLCWAVAINGAGLAFFGLLQKLTWNGQIFWIGPVPGNANCFASFVNRNNGGGYLNLCLAGAVVLMLWAANRDTRIGGRGHDAPHASRRHRSRHRDSGHRRAQLDTLKIASAALAAIIVGGILCTLSRGAGIALLGAAIVTAVVVVATGKKRLRTGSGAIVLVAGIGLVGWVGMRDAFVERFGTLAERDELVSDGRVPNWLDALKSVPDFWLTGSGLGTYRDIYLLYQQRYDPTWYYYAENQYVQALVEAGIPGLLLLLLAIAAVLAAVWKLIRSASDPLDYALGVGGLFAVVSQALHGFLDFGLYVPANMLLMATLCGAASGARTPGARTPGGRGSRRAAPSGPTPTTPSGPTPTAPSGPTPTAPFGPTPTAPFASFPETCTTSGGSGSAGASPSRAVYVTLLLGVLLGAWQVRAIADTNAAIDDVNYSTSPGGASEAEMRAAVATLEARVPRSSDDAELHYELAKARIYLHRVLVFNELRRTSPPNLSLDELWELASTTELHRKAYEWLRAGETDKLDALRTDEAVTEHLVPAQRDLQIARRWCPILAKIHLRLARLSFLDASPELDAEQADRARQLAPSDPYTFIECGLLDVHAGRIESACQSWQHALTLSEDYVQDVLTYARTGLDAETIVAQVLPASPTLLLRLAQQELPASEAAAPATAPLQPLLLQRVEQLAGEPDVADDERHHLLASVFQLRGDNVAALAEYEAAVQDRPFDVVWRHEYGKLLFQEGRLDEAHEQIRWCARRAPESLEYRRLLEAIHKARLGG